MSFKNEATRAYIYRVLIALVPIALAYGIVDAKQLPIWLGLISALLGFGMASMNTSTKKD